MTFRKTPSRIAYRLPLAASRGGEALFMAASDRCPVSDI
jgi:hypothetical protein